MPVVPTPPTIYDEVTTSSKWNQFRDAIRFLQSPPLAQLRQTSAQSLTNSTATAIQFQTEDVDTDIDGVGGHDSGLNTRYTARYPGWYSVSGGIGYNANAAGQRGVEWSINGVLVNGCGALLDATAANSTRLPGRAIQVYLALGDYLEAYGFQSSGGALSTAVTTVEQPCMTVRWVSI